MRLSRSWQIPRTDVLRLDLFRGRIVLEGDLWRAGTSQTSCSHVSSELSVTAYDVSRHGSANRLGAWVVWQIGAAGRWIGERDAGGKDDRRVCWTRPHSSYLIRLARFSHICRGAGIGTSCQS